MEYLNIGKVIGIHGLHGEISIKIDVDFLKFIDKKKFIFIEIKNQSYIPYKILSVKKETSQNFLILLKNLNNIDDVKFLNGKNLFLPIDQIEQKKLILKSNYLSSYYLHDHHLGLIGKIIEVKETAGQMLAFVEYKNKEVIIPMNSELILDIDESQKIILMELPEGLLSIYVD